MLRVRPWNYLPYPLGGSTCARHSRPRGLLEECGLATKQEIKLYIRRCLPCISDTYVILHQALSKLFSKAEVDAAVEEAKARPKTGCQGVADQRLL